MAQSTLYGFGSSTASTVDIIDDDARDLGNVDVKTFPVLEADITDDGTRTLGEAQITNQVDVDLAAQSLGTVSTELAAALAANATDVLRVSSPSPLDVSATTVPVEQQSAVAVENSSSTTVDPATEPTVSTVATAAGSKTGVAFGHDTVASSGTAEALNGGTSQAVGEGEAVAVKALADNSGTVYVGDSTVDSSSGFPLAAGEVVTLSVDDVSTLYVDVDTGGDGVAWTVEVN